MLQVVSLQFFFWGVGTHTYAHLVFPVLAQLHFGLYPKVSLQKNENGGKLASSSSILERFVYELLTALAMVAIV